MKRGKGRITHVRGGLEIYTKKRSMKKNKRKKIKNLTGCSINLVKFKKEPPKTIPR